MERRHMSERKTEMSLDEVLSSIKKMVMDEEPPVLELTDVISKDGSINKVNKDSVAPIKSADSKNPDMSSFLRLIQENADHMPESTPNGSIEPEVTAKVKSKRIVEPVTCAICTEIPACDCTPVEDKEENPLTTVTTNNDCIQNIIKEMAIQMVPEITTKFIKERLEEKLKNIDLQDMVKSVIEREVQKLFSNKSIL
jgi:hypothetical protein